MPPPTRSPTAATVASLRTDRSRRAISVQIRPAITAHARRGRITSGAIAMEKSAPAVSVCSRNGMTRNRTTPSIPRTR
jgi:hypothetical protein